MTDVKLNQIVAVEKSVRNQSETLITRLYQLLQKSNTQLNGLTREYRPHQDGGQSLPSESTLVQVKVETVLDDLRKIWTRLYDLTLTKDIANCNAKADIVVGDETIVSDVPVTTLLWLEKQLTDLRTNIDKLPLVDPATAWTPDPAQDNVLRSEPIETIRSEKVRVNHVKAPATDKHPAQVEIFTDDLPVGTWTTVKFTGAVTPARKEALQERVNEMLQAVKYARERGNGIVVEQQKMGDAILGYVIGE